MNWKLPSLKVTNYKSCQFWRWPKLKVAKIESEFSISFWSLLSCQFAKLPSCQIAKWPNCQVAKLPNCQVAKLPSCKLLNCELAIMERNPFRSCYFGFFSKTNHQMIIWVSRSKSMWYKAQVFQKYALNSQLQALQILTNNDEVENWSLPSFLLAVQ